MANEARENRKIFRLNLVDLCSNYYPEDNVMTDPDTFLKYYFFITQDAKYWPPINPRTVDSILRRLTNEFQNSSLLPDIKKKLLNVSTKYE